MTENTEIIAYTIFISKREYEELSRNSDKSYVAGVLLGRAVAREWPSKLNKEVNK